MQQGNGKKVSGRDLRRARTPDWAGRIWPRPCGTAPTKQATPKSASRTALQSTIKAKEVSDCQECARSCSCHADLVESRHEADRVSTPSAPDRRVVQASLQWQQAAKL